MNATAPHRTTRAIRIERLGPPEVLVERDIPLPDPGPDDVQLRVRAAGVNFADLLMRTGLYSTVPPRPFSAGFEVAGEVVQVGAGVSSWRAGDRAAALLRYGGQARDVIVPATQLFRYPDALSPVQAAAIPVVYLTAWVALFEAARVRAGETALILGAAGGVEAAYTTLTLYNQLMPPTINYEFPDPDCDLDYVPNVARKAQIEVALSNSFGFGGTNGTLVFRRWTGK
jgi:NADPH:quinone reductase-like Zn-dependent oxidoreductase